jgi:hypothetical protein
VLVLYVQLSLPLLRAGVCSRRQDAQHNGSVAAWSHLQSLLVAALTDSWSEVRRLGASTAAELLPLLPQPTIAAFYETAVQGCSAAIASESSSSCIESSTAEAAMQWKRACGLLLGAKAALDSYACSCATTTASDLQWALRDQDVLFAALVHAQLPVRKAAQDVLMSLGKLLGQQSLLDMLDTAIAQLSKGKHCTTCAFSITCLLNAMQLHTS